MPTNMSLGRLIELLEKKDANAKCSWGINGEIWVEANGIRYENELNSDGKRSLRSCFIKALGLVNL